MSTERMAQPELTPAWHEELGARLRAELTGLTHPALWFALGVLLAVFLLAPQLPLRYRIVVGNNEGYGSDLPYLRNFNDGEQSQHGSFRWTSRESSILLPGTGQRNLLVQLDLKPASPEMLEPQTFAVWAGGRPLADIPLRLEGGRVQLLVPAAAQSEGGLALSLRSATFAPLGDPRQLGIPLGGVTVSAPAALGSAPDWAAVLRWLGALTLSWLVLRHVLGGLHGRAAATQPAVLAMALLTAFVALAALINPPRWAFGAQAALTVSASAYLLAMLVYGLLPRLMKRLGTPLDAQALAWLSFMVVLSFALRYGGRLYPESMPGDIGFHHNRFLETVFGQIYLVSVNRGVPFPYPPGPYILVAPLTLIGLEMRTVLQLGAALVDALSAVVVYVIAVRALGQRVALLAAGIYVFTAATFMTTWWSFSSHIYTQFLHLLLIAGLVRALQAWQGDNEVRRRWWILGIVVLLGLVFLGHFGFLINTALLLGLLISSVWVASWRNVAWVQQIRWPLTIAGVGAGSIAAGLFYSAYLPLFLGQLEVVRAGGLVAVTEREPASATVLLTTLWQAGLVSHFGLFPLLLMPMGLWLLVRQARAEPGLGPRRALLGLMAGSLSIAGVFALWPFVTGVGNSPRWLMFIAWVVAVGAAGASEVLWQRGWLARVGLLLMGLLTLANTAWIWLGPMLWRIRPPEPF